MSSKSTLWQANWQIDYVTDIATHDSGLQVRLDGDVGVSENSDEVALLLTPKHGLHNATAMVQRLVREGAALLIDPYARGWRGGSKNG
jgi:hypothetical protein